VYIKTDVWNVMVNLEYAFHETILYEGLLQAIKSQRVGSRVWAAYMLGRMRETKAYPVLLPLLRDKEELVRSNAVMAIGMIIAALEEGEEEELRQIAYRAIKQLEKNDQSEKVRQYIELAVEAFRG
jgi:HEAT repeat protein